MRGDPTYIREHIDANPIWKLAFLISEIENDLAPLGWARYIPTAEYLLQYYVERTKEEDKSEPLQQI